MAGESISSGGDSQTFGSHVSDERSVGLTLDEVLADYTMSQNEEMFSFRNQSFLAMRGTGITDEGRASSWTFFVRPEYENRTVVLVYADRGWSEYDWGQGVEYLPVDMTNILSPDEIFALHTGKLPEYFCAEDTEADIFLSNGTYEATVYGPALYETLRFDAYTGEWMQ